MYAPAGPSRPIPRQRVGPALSRPHGASIPGAGRGGRSHVCRADAASGNPQFEVQLVPSISDISAADWDACALRSAELDPAGGGTNPFVSHAFLKALEDSGSVTRATGWMPQHLILRQGPSKRVVGAVPLFLKAHSYGEYVFDQSWANAAARNGIRYYPKLQSCVPFTPCTGPRLLIHPEAPAGTAETLAKALRAAADEFNVSSLHVTFPMESEVGALRAAGFQKRVGVQYHWVNRGYKTFDDFLMALQQRRRKSVRQERKKATEGLRGKEIKAATWDAFYDFYIDTAERKWGQAYLTREFFHMIGEGLGDSVVLVLAEEAGGPGKPVGAALNLVGSNAIFGRNWGCARFVPGLHFEVCYYQAIEEAIERGLARVEAGAQGEHKIQRGYLPTQTLSAHYVRDPRLADAVGHFLQREEEQMADVMTALGEESPYKDGAPGAAGAAATVRVTDVESRGGSDASTTTAADAVEKTTTSSTTAAAGDGDEGGGGRKGAGAAPGAAAAAAAAPPAASTGNSSR